MGSSFSLLKLGNIVAEDEKSKPPESLRQMNSLSQDGSELGVSGTVNGVAEEHSRIPMKHFPNSFIRTAEIIGRWASCWTAWFFSLTLLYLKYSKPVLQAQRSHPLWLDIIGMLSFTLFACGVSVMLLVKASFTHMQIVVMVISFCALLFA